MFIMEAIKTIFLISLWFNHIYPMGAENQFNFLCAINYLAGGSKFSKTQKIEEAFSLLKNIIDSPIAKTNMFFIKRC